jgi:hypothetical protein
MNRFGKNSNGAVGLSSLDASFNQNEFPRHALRGGVSILAGQLTKRRMRTFITSPNAKNSNAVDEPP